MFSERLRKTVALVCKMVAGRKVKMTYKTLFHKKQITGEKDEKADREARTSAMLTTESAFCGNCGRVFS